MYQALRSNGFVPLKGQTVDASSLKICSAKVDSFEENVKDATSVGLHGFDCDEQECNGDKTPSSIAFLAFIKYG